MFQHGPGIGFLHLVSIEQHFNDISHLRHDRQVMGNVKCRGIKLINDIANRRQYFDLGRNIKCGRRLIKDDQVGPAGHRPGAMAAALLAACGLGFLPWNLGRARVFMGDTGSLALGFALGALLIFGVATGAFSLPVALMVMLVFLTDSSLTLLLRVLKGERWYTAHKQHLYQRLIAHGWTHGRVLLFYQAINLTLVVPGLVVADNYPALAWIVALASILVMGLGWFLVLRNIGVCVRAG